ncbi:DNA-binding response regulator [Ornithinimicrobium sufpigmenti]|uniref:response regulator transcription factor n=1 Tax=Ornithinimicrobium sufpigmenti TaxID=2508882 RepID=UPI001EDD5E36|nr:MULTISPECIES: response regulator transcription factor [unclassified Ornithinimicrobium]
MSPVTVALRDDYDVVVHGLEAMLAPFADRVQVVELNVDTATVTPVDVTLYDTFAQSQADSEDISRIVENPTNGRVVVYSWNAQPELVRQALERGCAGYVDKSTGAEELVAAIERIAAGEVVTLTPRPEPSGETPYGTWPGKEHGLSAREAEILALITQGMTNEGIAARAYLSINTVKSYIRTAYRKIGVTRRSQAVRWGMEHGMLPDHTRELR